VETEGAESDIGCQRSIPDKELSLVAVFV